MTDQEDNINLGKIFCDDNNPEMKSWACLGKPVPERWFCFCPNFLSFFLSSLVAFGEFTFQRLVTSQLFGLENCAVRQDTFHPHRDYEQVSFNKKSGI